MGTTSGFHQFPVRSVAGVARDLDGDVPLTPADIGAATAVALALKADAWVASTVKGVRGKATRTSGGSGLPNGDYRVRLTGGGGTGATARVIISGGVLNDYSGRCDAIVLEPGSGYTSAPSLSTSAADWFVFHSSGTLATIAGGAVFPVVTFALADNLLSVRTLAGDEQLLVHNGRFRADQLGMLFDSVTDDSAAMQDIICAIMRGRSQIALEYGGAPDAGGSLYCPAGTAWLNGKTIYVNSTGTPTGTEVVGFRLLGAAKGSARPTRPDGAASGTKFLYGILQIGNAATTGVFDTVSRGVTVENLEWIGGWILYGVQHSPRWVDIRVVPDYPIGAIGTVSGARVNGHGLYMTYCSTAAFQNFFITSGDQVYFGNNNDLDGAYIENCDQVSFTDCAFSFCRRGMEIRGASRSTSIFLNNVTFEANNKESLLATAVRNLHARITVLTRGVTDGAVSHVQIGRAPDAAIMGDTGEQCFNAVITNSSINASPTLGKHTVFSLSGTNTVVFAGDYTIRYALGVVVTVYATTGDFRATVTAVSYSSVTDVTTVVLNTILIAAGTTALRVMPSDSVSAQYAAVSTSGGNTVVVAGDQTAIFKTTPVNRAVILNNAVNGDTTASATSVTYNSGTNQTTIVLGTNAVNGNTTSIQSAYDNYGIAVDVQYCNGASVTNNSITNCKNAVRFRQRATNAEYLRGCAAGLTDDDQLTGPEVVWDTGSTAKPAPAIISGTYLALGTSTALPPLVTIASGVITISASAHRVDVEGGLPGTDDLDTINLASGTPYHDQLLSLQTYVDANDVRLTSAGNIVGAGLPLTLDTRNGKALLSWNSATSKWVLIGFYAGDSVSRVTKGTATAGQTTFTLNRAMPSGAEDSVLLYVGGQPQDSAQYTFNGTTTATLGFAMAAGDAWRAINLG